MTDVLPSYAFQNYPTIFQPMNLRSGIRYRSLSKHFFTKLEKEWCCSMILGTTNSCNKFCCQYNISVDVMSEWLEIYQRNEPFEDGFCISMYDGCPMDAISVAIIQNFITEQRSTTGSRNVDNFDDSDQIFCDLVSEQILNSWQRKHNI